jgi:hypothetical protein
MGRWRDSTTLYSLLRVAGVPDLDHRASAGTPKRLLLRIGLTGKRELTICE